jgi:hypothetical protein
MMNEEVHPRLPCLPVLVGHRTKPSINVSSLHQQTGF